MNTHTQPSTRITIQVDPLWEKYATEYDDPQGFEHLEEVFNSIANPCDWKAEIFCWIKREDFDAAKAATVFYTATELTMTGRVIPRSDRAIEHPKDLIEVYAPGYRKGPAA